MRRCCKNIRVLRELEGFFTKNLSMLYAGLCWFIICNNVSGWKGFVRTAFIPTDRACSCVSCKALAVKPMIGTAAFSKPHSPERIRCVVSKPSICGILISITTKAASLCESQSKHCIPLATTLTVKSFFSKIF